ncbi:MAG: NAD-dependent epimerase/dehydratase family protein [Bacteroidetes bacterium]|jgi:nucleoside-diphosphate-sugar epimerase|nr:NAD-dependent epimerase/dehydratase family protein [Bacteroidota bacterium]
MNRILITGASGFLGGAIARSKKLEGQSLILNGRTFTDSNISKYGQLLKGDLSSESTFHQLKDEHIDIIINCASKSSPWGTYRSFHQANVISQENLISLAEAKKVKKYIYISSPSIFFDYSDQINIPNDRKEPTSFVNSYAKTKYIAEQKLKKSSLNYTILRPRAIIGARDRVIMPRLINAAAAGRLKIFGNGLNVVDLTPINNLVNLICKLALQSTPLPNKAYNISNGRAIPLWPYINDTLEQIGYPRVRKKVNRRLGLAIGQGIELYHRWFKPEKEPVLTKYSVGTLSYSFSFNIEEAIKELNFEPRQNIEEALGDFIKWYQSEIHGNNTL